MKCRLSEPVLLEGIMNFISATTLWLTQIGIHTAFPQSDTTYAPLTLKPLAFPVPDEIPDTLK